MYQSDLTVTIASNTAIESVIMGTPAVAYNIWSPDIEDHIYTTHGSIPGCSSRSELRSFLLEYDKAEAIQEQKVILEQDYMVKNNSEEQIIEKIWSELEN
jgi:hypothetical protein